MPFLSLKTGTRGAYNYSQNTELLEVFDISDIYLQVCAVGSAANNNIEVVFFKVYHKLTQ